MSEQTTNPVDALQALINSRLLDVNTSLPATIISYSGGVARVQPKPQKRFNDGDILDYPIIPNVRVCWPSFSGGTAGVKGPIKPGDNCLLVFSQQAVDGSDDRRMFDLQDAYAVMCDLGETSGQSSSNDDMVMFFGGAFIKITMSGMVEINAPGGTNIKTAGMNLTDVSGGGTTFNMSGNLNHTSGSIISLGKKIDGSHTHGGVQSGSSNTTVPNA